MITSVIYDHDGTLVDSLAMVIAATNRVLERNGFPTAPAPAVVAAMVLATTPRMGHHSGVADPLVQRRLAQEFYAEARVIGPLLSRSYPGVPELVATFARSGLAQGVVSNNEGEVVRIIMRHLGIAPHFAVLYGEEDVPAPKPDPRGLLQAVRALGHPASTCLYVGDSGGDAQAAHAAGMRAVGVTWGTHSREQMLGMGFDRLIDHPRELVPLIHAL
jgi:phosphoglycolate phosphatase